MDEVFVDFDEDSDELHASLGERDDVSSRLNAQLSQQDEHLCEEAEQLVEWTASTRQLDQRAVQQDEVFVAKNERAVAMDGLLVETTA